MLSVGEILRLEREKQHLTMQQVEKGTRIRAKLLQAAEDNAWDQFTSKVYMSGVIRNYAKFLGMDVKKAEAYFRRDYEKKEELKFKKNVAAKYFKPQTKKAVIALFATIFLLFAAYFGYQLNIFLSPPKVAIIAPTKTTFRNVERITVQGKTEKEANIVVLGERVFPNKEGIFEYDFPLKKGSNNIIIEVTGANGKKTMLQKVFVLE